MTPPRPADDAAGDRAAGSRRARAINRYFSHISRPMMSAARLGNPQLTAAVIRAIRPGVNRSLAALSPIPADTRTVPVRDRTDDGQVRGEWVFAAGTPPPSADRSADRVLYYLHGSGYVICSPRTHRGLVARLGRRTGLPAFSLDYRLGPDHRLPAGGDDAVRGYRWLLDLGYAAENIVVAGDSAGGHLALDLLAVNHATGTPQPAALVAFSPLYDPSFRLAVRDQRSGVRDPLIDAVAAQRILRLYTGDAALDDPRMLVSLSPDMALPPTLIQYGSLEVMGGDARAYQRALLDAGAEVDLQRWPGQGHVFQMFPGLAPEARQAVSTAAQFISATLAGDSEADAADRPDVG
ncbi:hypothetical protein GCM10009624_27150 [Gordonia sinesedis]